MFCGPGGSKSRLAKAAVAESSCQLNDQKWHAVAAQSTCRSQNIKNAFGSWDVEKVRAVVAWSTFRSQNAQTHHVWKTFGTWDFQNVHAVVARSIFRSQNGRNTAGSPFWQWRCPKSVKRSTFRSQNMTNTSGLEPFWKLGCSKSVRCCGTKHRSKPKC